MENRDPGDGEPAGISSVVFPPPVSSFRGDTCVLGFASINYCGNPPMLLIAQDAAAEDRAGPQDAGGIGLPINSHRHDARGVGSGTRRCGRTD
jgi:hypothetical protein